MSTLFKWLPSMETLQTNVVFARLTRHSRWPSPRTTMRLFVAALLVGTGGAVARLVVDPFLRTTAIRVIALSGLAVVLLSPPVAALVTTITTVADMQSEAHRLTQVSLLSKEEIVSGYLYAALYRLRLLWVLVFGLLLPLVATFLIAGLLCDADLIGIPGALFVLAVWLTGAAMGGVFNWLAVCIGVWQSLRSRRLGPAVTTAMAILGSAEMLVFAACGSGVLLGPEGICYCPALILTLMVVFLAYLTDKMRR
jgi:hypothetical protein